MNEIYSRRLNPESHPFQRLHQCDTVPSHDHHPDIIASVSVDHLNAVVHHQIHERIETTQNSRNLPVSVQTQGEFTVHVFLQFWWSCLRHDAGGWLSVVRW